MHIVPASLAFLCFDTPLLEIGVMPERIFFYLPTSSALESKEKQERKEILEIIKKG